MARTISWLSQLRAIRRSVSSSVRSHYDRRDLEVLFELQPSAANKLMAMLPRVAVGSAKLVERGTLDSFLARMDKAEDPQQELIEIRREKAGTSRRKLRALARRDSNPTPMTALPDRIRLTPGEVSIRFATGEQLVESLWMLADVLTSEADAFLAAYEPHSAERAAEKLEVSEMKQIFAELRKREAEMSTGRGAENAAARA